MLNIKWENGDHKIDYTFSDEQLESMQKYRDPLKRKLAEEQAALHRKDSDKYRSLGYVADLLDQGVYEPYLGAIGGGDKYIFHVNYGADSYGVQYSYLDNKPIWLTDLLGIKSDGVYRISPTGLGYIVKYEVDLTDYENW